jgi:hypothetical protein
MTGAEWTQRGVSLPANTQAAKSPDSVTEKMFRSALAHGAPITAPCPSPGTQVGPSHRSSADAGAQEKQPNILAALHTGGRSFPRSADNQFIRFTRQSPDIQSGFAAAQLLQGRNKPT